jgi:hypothetical protein
MKKKTVLQEKPVVSLSDLLNQGGYSVCSRALLWTVCNTIGLFDRPTRSHIQWYGSPTDMFAHSPTFSKQGKLLEINTPLAN